MSAWSDVPMMKPTIVDELSSWRIVQVYEEAHADLDVDQVAQGLLGELDEATLRAFALRWVIEQIHSLRRSRARAVEEEAGWGSRLVSEAAS